MTLIALIVLVGGAFAIAMFASGTHFGRPPNRRKDPTKSDRRP